MQSAIIYVLVFVLVTAIAVLGFVMILEFSQCMLAEKFGITVEPIVLAICA